MADRPIIFSTAMVKALLDGRKFQTRRVVKPQPGELDSVFRDGGGFWHVTDSRGAHMSELRIPHSPGDRLYVREAWAEGMEYDDDEPCSESRVYYRADGEPFSSWTRDDGTHRDGIPWRPSIHMPRWASRLTLTVTDVLVQRLQEISEADAQAEGAEALPADEAPDKDFRSYVWGFQAIWGAIHGPEAWEANPWVAAYSFTVQHGNIDALDGVTHDGFPIGGVA